MQCGKTVTIKCNKNHSQLVVTFYNESGNGLGNVVLTNVSNGIFNAPSSSTKFRIQVADENITSQTVGEVLVYIDNEISQLKNDLDKLNSLPIGSIIQIEADKDNIETTTQKYGWQYLGTSNIECNDGSLKLLVTNVYRKNN